MIEPFEIICIGWWK